MGGGSSKEKQRVGRRKRERERERETDRSIRFNVFRQQYGRRSRVTFPHLYMSPGSFICFYYSCRVLYLFRILNIPDAQTDAGTHIAHSLHSVVGGRFRVIAAGFIYKLIGVCLRGYACACMCMCACPCVCVCVCMCVCVCVFVCKCVHACLI